MGKEQKQIERSFVVLVDTKEKRPWSFSSSAIVEVKHQALKTGDYTVEGLENLLCIERKKSVAELAQNIHQPRFSNELERMKAFPYRYILLESSMQKVMDYPHSEDLPAAVIAKINMRGPYILRCLIRMQIKYGINIIYCGNADNAVLVATDIMKEVVFLDAQNKTSTTQFCY